MDIQEQMNELRFLVGALDDQLKDAVAVYDKYEERIAALEDLIRRMKEAME